MPPWAQKLNILSAAKSSPYKTCQGGNLDGYPSGSIDGGERLATQQTSATVPINTKMLKNEIVIYTYYVIHAYACACLHLFIFYLLIRLSNWFIS